MVRKIKKLYTIGDSWTYGDELKNPKKECWPSVLSRELDCELINQAAPAGPNDWMFRKTIEWVCTQKDVSNTLVIVAWSEPNRREENYKFIVYGKKLWYKVMKHFYNNELAYYKSICYMVTLQEFLKSRNVKYLFFQPWCDILESEKKLQKVRDKKIKWLSNEKDEYQKECYQEDLTIGNIIKEVDKKYVIGKAPIGHLQRHPNKNEHKIMAKFIKEKLLEIYP
jgi:hypothetical protein